MVIDNIVKANTVTSDIVIDNAVTSNIKSYSFNVFTLYSQYKLLPILP